MSGGRTKKVSTGGSEGQGRPPEGREEDNVWIGQPLCADMQQERVLGLLSGGHSKAIQQAR